MRFLTRPVKPTGLLKKANLGRLLSRILRHSFSRQRTKPGFFNIPTVFWRAAEMGHPCAPRRLHSLRIEIIGAHAFLGFEIGTLR